MKVVITGATGFVGQKVLSCAISNPEISFIYVLSRRPIDESLSASPKVHVIIHRDFERYPSDLLEELQGAGACLWCLGGKVEDFPSLQVARTVGVDYTLAAAAAFAKYLVVAPENEEMASMKNTTKFKFVYCSGNGAEWDQDRKLWVFPDTRKLKGAAERGLFDIAATTPKTFETIVLRPGGVLPSDTSRVVGTVASFLTPVVPVECLARAMVRVALDPAPDSDLEMEEEPRRQRILENKDILRVGHQD